MLYNNVLLRPHLEYAVQCWSLHLHKIAKLDVQHGQQKLFLLGSTKLMKKRFPL